MKAATKAGITLPYQQYYCPIRNQIPFDKTLLRSGVQSFYNCTNCREGKQHCVYVTNKTAKRYVQGGVINCRICHKDPSRSHLESIVEKILVEKFPTYEYYLECVAVKEFSGTIDFTIFNPRVLIQVDGIGHFIGYGYAKASKQQGEVDQRCNDLARAQGWQMLRIHYKDVEGCEGVIQSARIC